MVAVPTSVAAVADSPTQVTVSWAAVTGATGYDVEEDGVVVVANTSALSAVRTGLAPGSLHTYRVRARVGAVVLVDPNTPSGQQPMGQSSGWNLTFSDEFTGTSLDELKWEPYYADTAYWNATTPGGHLSNTDEPEAYDISAISFDAASVMTFTMRNESIVAGLPYTSGMVSSYASFNQTYGWFEARLRVDNVNGAWPAFWLFPLDQDWNNGPEIDIFEAWPPGDWNNVWWTSLHQQGQAAWSAQRAVDAVSNWHVYAVRWHAGGYEFYLDGVSVGTLTNSAYFVAEPMYIHCNLAGDMNNWPAAGDLPITMDVDYIRVWEAA